MIVTVKDSVATFSGHEKKTIELETHDGRVYIRRGDASSECIATGLWNGKLKWDTKEKGTVVWEKVEDVIPIRGAVRSHVGGIDGTYEQDLCFTTCCCAPCAAGQMQRELRLRGIMDYPAWVIRSAQLLCCSSDVRKGGYTEAMVRPNRIPSAVGYGTV